MARKAELKDRFSTMITLEKKEYDEFINIIGFGNFSNEIRAMIKDRVQTQKNDEALDVLNLEPHKVRSDSSHIATRSNNTRQSTLFEVFATKDKRDDIDKYVNSIHDKDRIDKIWLNSKVMYNIADTRRKKLAKGLIH